MQNILLAARDVRRIDARLEIGAVEARIEVTGGATLIETEMARISETRDANALKSLPMNDRSMYSFLQQVPGMLVMTGGNASSGWREAAETRKTRQWTASASTTCTTAV